MRVALGGLASRDRTVDSQNRESTSLSRENLTKNELGQDAESDVSRSRSDISGDELAVDARALLIVFEELFAILAPRSSPRPALDARNADREWAATVFNARRPEKAGDKKEEEKSKAGRDSVNPFLCLCDAAPNDHPPSPAEVEDEEKEEDEDEESLEAYNHCPLLFYNAFLFYGGAEVLLRVFAYLSSVRECQVDPYKQLPVNTNPENVTRVSVECDQWRRLAHCRLIRLILLVGESEQQRVELKEQAKREAERAAVMQQFAETMSYSLPDSSCSKREKGGALIVSAVSLKLTPAVFAFTEHQNGFWNCSTRLCTANVLSVVCISSHIVREQNLRP